MEEVLEELVHLRAEGDALVQRGGRQPPAAPQHMGTARGGGPAGGSVTVGLAPQRENNRRKGQSGSGFRAFTFRQMFRCFYVKIYA